MYRSTIKIAVTLIAVIVGLVYAQQPLWHNLYPSYNGLAFGDDRFIAVTGDGLIRGTSDGADWSQRFPGIARAIYSIAYGDGTFIATQSSSSALRSTDAGADWSAFSTGTGDHYKYLTFGNGRFVGVGDDGITFVYDGEEWESLGVSSNVYHAAFGAGRYVVVGNAIYSSTNALGWATSTISTPNGVSAVAFGNDKFVAVGSTGTTVYTSPDGVRDNWTSASANAPVRVTDMTFGNGRFVAVGDNGIAGVSTDGTSWTVSTLNENDNFTAVKYGNGVFMALGVYGSVYTSPDGSVWTKRADGRFMSYKTLTPQKLGSLFG